MTHWQRDILRTGCWLVGALALLLLVELVVLSLVSPAHGQVDGAAPTSRGPRLGSNDAWKQGYNGFHEERDNGPF